jgi:hypothetical protein
MAFGALKCPMRQNFQPQATGLTGGLSRAFCATAVDDLSLGQTLVSRTQADIKLGFIIVNSVLAIWSHPATATIF